MKMSFWSLCQNLVHRLRYAHRVPSPRLRRRQMWLAEGLEARTLLSSTPALVADINPGAASSAPWENQIVAIGSTTYFTADDGVHGQELWKSDGTAAGTKMVRDVNAGSLSSNPGNLINVNGTLFFTADDGVHGNELWKSDGTVSGTTLIKDISYDPFLMTGAPGSQIGDLTDVNGTLFFFEYDGYGGSGLWTSDGTEAGTVRVAAAMGSELTNVNGTLFFAQDDGITGTELWKSDGTEAGTTLVDDIFPGATTIYGTPSFYPGQYGGYFPNSSSPANLTNVNGTLFFTAYNSTAGRELWRSDGTAAGTTLVKDIRPGGFVPYYSYTSTPYSSNPGHLTNVNGSLFFSANDGTAGNTLWKSDGTVAGTVRITSPGTGSYPDSITDINGTIFFEAYNSAGWELWKSDGTAAGTMLVKDINPGTGSSNPYDFTIVNGTLFFTANDGTHGYELWQSNGTAAGTMMVADVNPGSATASPSNLVTANGTLFFTADDGIHGVELWTFPAVSGTPIAGLDVAGFPTTTTAGAPGSFTVTARNADGTTNASYTGTVRFTTTDPQATIIDPATGHAVALTGFTYIFTAADAGVHTFSATLRTAGTQSITAADTQTPAENGTEGRILVQAAAASTMTVGGFPSTTTAGVGHTVTVTLTDPYGNVASGYTGTVHFTSSDARAVLPANYTFTGADAGKHTFSATLKTAGMQSITAADTLTSVLAATEGGITVNAAAARQFIISAPSSVKAGVPFSLTITVEDAFGNIITGYTGTVHFTSSDKTALLPANYTFTAADKGAHTFTGLVLRKNGKQTITITDTLDSWLTGSATEQVH